MAYEGAPEPADKDHVLLFKIARDSGSEAGDATAGNQTTLNNFLAREYTPVPVAVGASASSTIPATATSWAFVLLTGTGTLGGVAVPLGVPLSGGALTAALAYTTAGSSSAFILYETSP